MMAVEAPMIAIETQPQNAYFADLALARLVHVLLPFRQLGNWKA